VVQSVLVQGDRQPSVDGMAYFEAGRHLLAGDGYMRHGSPELHFPPVTPLAFAAIERVVGDEVAALRVWHLVWGVIAVVLITMVAWLVSRDDDAAVATAWIATTVGGVVSLSIRGGSGSELPVVCLLLGAAVLLAPVLQPSERSARSMAVRFAGAGTLVGLAYLTRPEALLVGGAVLVVAGVLAVRGGGRPTAAVAWSVVGAAVIVAALAAPYVLHLHRHTGAWSFTAKTQDASIEAWASVAAGDRLARDRVLYEIQPDGVTLGPPTRSLTALAADDPAGWSRILVTNVGQLLRLYLVIQIVPFFVLFAGLAEGWRRRRDPFVLLVAPIALGPVVTCLAFFSMPRYLMATSAVLTAFGGVGLTRWIGARPLPRQRRWWTAVAVGCAVSLLIAAWPLLPGTGMGEPTEQREAGRWIAANTAPDARIMTRSFHVQGYAEREVVAMPVGELGEVLAYARRTGATHLVADATTIRGRRPELVEPLLGPSTPDGLELVHELEVRGRSVRIFELDPAPEPSDLPPRWLGYVSD
jgi:hypothetical protein